MKQLKTIEDVREYVQRDYWEDGKQKEISGYENTNVDWWWNGRYLQVLSRAFNLCGKTLLDLGCAYGEFVGVAALFGVDAYGVDLSDYAIKVGKERIAWNESKLKQGSIHSLSYDNEMFDFLHSQQVFEHLPSQYSESLAQETFRVAKPGCILWAGLVLDLEEQFPDGRNPLDPDKSHINIRTKQWWNERFLSAGWVEANDLDKNFRKITTEPDGYSFFKHYDWHSICYRKEL